MSKLQARVDEFDRKRDSLMEDDVVGYATLNGAIMGLEIAIRSLSPRAALAELDTVEITKDIQDRFVLAGDRGVIVLVHGAGEAFDVEIFDANGITVGVVTIPAQLLRKVEGSSPISSPRDQEEEGEGEGT
jgi:hypothetical protein